MQSKHKRKIVLSGVDLVGANLSCDLKLMGEIMDSIEILMIKSNYLDRAPFLWIGIIFRYGLKNETTPHYETINKKYGDLPLSLELDMRVLLTADEINSDILRNFLEIATLDCLIHAGKKYKLNMDNLLGRRKELGNIPEWDIEMDKSPELIIERYKETVTQE